MISKRKNLLKYPIYSLFLLPLFFVFHGYTENFPLVPTWPAFLLLLKYAGISLLLTGLFFFIFRSWRMSAMLAFLIMSFQIFFGPVHDFFKSWLPNSFLVKYSFLLPASFIFFVLVCIYFRKKKPALTQLLHYINIVLLAFILIDIIQIAIKLGTKKPENALAPLFTACDTCSRPDIYMLIADEYSGDIPLREVLGFDNSAFKNELKKRGFHIVDSSLSNYNYTPFTIASLLSMEYLQGIEGRNRNLNDRRICFEHINKNPVIDFFHHYGYSFHNYSIFGFAGKPPLHSTTFYKTGIELVTASTFLSRVDRDIRFNTVTRFKIQSEIERISYYHLHLNEALYEDTWEKVSTASSVPRFIYTHIEMPHYPYYFDKNGKPNPLKDLTDENSANTKQYVEYLQYCNKKYLALIDHIFAHAKQPPVIIFMSDHAFREYAGDSVEHKYHFMNFNSIYLPEKKYQGFYKGISTVNQFRVLLNTQFRQQLPLLKDSTSYLIQ